MKKINSISVRAISMSGFKCFEVPASFRFGDSTFISASNGQGKSSIADAIAFAFVGMPFFGDKGLDRLHNKNTHEMKVSVDFIDDTGETHNLTRTRKRENTAITYNGLNIRQSDLNTAVGDKDIFLSILNPLYFINVLGDSGKNLIEKLLPAVKHDEILSALTEYSRDILAGQQFSSPETFIKNRREELKEQEETLIGYRNRQELLKHQRNERDGNLSKLRASIAGITNEMAELVHIRDNSRDLTAEESALAEFRRRRAELLSDAAQSGFDKAMQDILGEIRAVEKSIAQKSAAQYISSYAGQIADADAVLKYMYDEHSRLNKALAGAVVGYKCPACAVMITAENIDAIKKDLERRLSVIMTDGKTAKNNLAEIQTKDSIEKRKFDGHKDTVLAMERSKLSALNKQLQELNVSRALDAEDYGERFSALDNQIIEQERRLANGNWTLEQAQQFAALEKSKNECAAKIEALNADDADDYAGLIEETESEIIRLKRLINEAINYTGKRIELMLDGLKMNNAEIVLTEIIKSTGEVKDCFRFSYDGRDYKCLSLSEKICAGVEVSTLIQRLSGRNYPIFIDNAESLCSIGNVQLCGQMIYSRVVRNQALQVTYKDSESIKTA